MFARWPCQQSDLIIMVNISGFHLIYMLIIRKYGLFIRTFGFTIIELMIVLLILSILTGTGLFYVNTDNYRLKSEVNNFKSTLEMARSEAVKRNISARVLLNPDGYEVRLIDNEETVLGTYGFYDGIGLHSKEMGQLTTSGITFAYLGTASNSHVKIANNNRNYSVYVNPAGRIRMDGPFEN